MKTKTYLKRILMSANIYINCSYNPKHRWWSENGIFKFIGSWEREETNGSLFDRTLNNMPMPKALSLNEYELDIKFGTAICPLCWLSKKERHPLLIDKENGMGM